MLNFGSYVDNLKMRNECLEKQLAALSCQNT